MFLHTGDGYLVSVEKIFKKYLIAEIIVQGTCLVANIICLFLFRDAMKYTFTIAIVLGSLIKGFSSICAKHFYLKELRDLLIKEELLEHEPREIRNYLLEKYGKSYNFGDIEKCLGKIK